jgi:hypothetical protein
MKKEHVALEEEFERDHNDEQAWTADPPESRRRSTLGTQLTVRLDNAQARLLRRIAEQYRIGYTSLVRQWLEERLERESASAELVRPSVSQNGYTAIRENIDASSSGSVRWTRLPKEFELVRR